MKDRILPYLRRIQVTKPDVLSRAGISNLINQHLKNLPVENISTHFAREDVGYDMQLIYEAIVLGKRGGLPIQLNLLFYQLLSDLGCSVSALETDYHLVCEINLNDKKYIADVGLVHGPAGVLECKPGIVQLSGNSYFRIDIDPDGNLIIKRSKNGIDFEEVYRAYQKPVKPIQLLEKYNQQIAAAKAISTEKLYGYLLTKTGYAKILNHELVVMENADSVTESIINEFDLLSKAEQHFGVFVDLLE